MKKRKRARKAISGVSGGRKKSRFSKSLIVGELEAEAFKKDKKDKKDKEDKKEKKDK